MELEEPGGGLVLLVGLEPVPPAAGAIGGSDVGRVPGPGAAIEADHREAPIVLE